MTWFPWFTETARLNCFFVEFEHAGIWRPYLLTFYFFGWPLNWLPPVMLWTSLMLGHESWPWSSHDKIHSVPFYVSIALFNPSVCDQVSCCLLALIGVSFYNKSRIIFFSQLLMWLVIIGVIIKVIPLVISMWVILRQTHFATLIWCEIVGFLATFPLSLFLLLFSSAYPT